MFFVLTTRRIDMESISSNSVTAPVFQCPGHRDFFHHYNNYDKAKRQAQEAIDNLLKNLSVESACYQLLHKDSVEGKESGYFDRLNSVYKYAIVLTYQHKDNAEECSFYQEMKNKTKAA